MKRVFIVIVFFFFSKMVFSQNEFPPNSLGEYFQNTTISYRYIEETQTHDYSGNWDIDGDGIKDSIMFVGTGGAHLYFQLHIYLSSEKKHYGIWFLDTDNPRLESIDLLKKNGYESYNPEFVVYDFNEDGLMDIYISIQGQAAVGLPKKLVHSDNRFYTPNPIIVYYNAKKRKIMVENLISGKKLSLNHAIRIADRDLKKERRKFYRTYGW